MNIFQINQIEEDLRRLQELDKHVKLMFDAADSKDFIIGVRLKKDNKEGQMVSRLRELAQCLRSNNE